VWHVNGNCVVTFDPEERNKLNRPCAVPHHWRDCAGRLALLSGSPLSWAQTMHFWGSGAPGVQYVIVRGSTSELDHMRGHYVQGFSCFRSSLIKTNTIHVTESISDHPSFSIQRTSLADIEAILITFGQISRVFVTSSREPRSNTLTPGGPKHSPVPP
jgi:hypothetical protein